MSNVDINVTVGANKGTSDYKTIILKSNHSFAQQVTLPNVKYIVKYNYDLGGTNFTMPYDCILEFDGGVITNGTIKCRNTRLIGNLDKNIDNIAVFSGTYKDYTNDNLYDKEYDSEAYSGLGRKIIGKNVVNGKNILTQAMLADKNTLYIIQYDYNLNGATITIPANCVLYFEGGKITNGSIVFSNTLLLGNYLFENIITMTGSVQNDFLDAEYINFTTDEREIFYLLKLYVKHLKFKKSHIYDISSPQISQSTAYWLVLKGEELNNRELDFNGSTIYFPVSNKTLIQYELMHLNNLKIKNLNFEGGSTNYSSFFHIYNGASNFAVEQCSFKNTGVTIYILSPNYEYSSYNVNINASFEGEGTNTAIPCQCVRMSAVDNFKLDINVKNYNLNRIIGLDGCSNGIINLNASEIKANSGAILIQEYAQTDEDANNVFLHCRNILINSFFNGYIFGHIFQFGHYVSTDDASVAVFANRNEDVHVDNIKLNIFARDVYGTPYWIIFPNTGRQIGTNGKHMNVRFWFDIDANIDIITSKSPGGSLVSLESPITPVDADDDINFTEMCLNLNIYGNIQYAGNPYISITNLDKHSLCRIAIKSVTRFDFYTGTLENSNPVFVFDRCENFRGLLASGKYYGTLKFNSTNPFFFDNQYLPNVKQVSVNDLELDTGNIYSSDFTRYCYRVCASASLTYDISNTYNKCAINDEYTILLKNITGLNRPFVVNDGSTEILSTYLIAGASVILKIGKINGVKYFYLLGQTATS